jgi:hypothetical protein
MRKLVALGAALALLIVGIAPAVAQEDPVSTSQACRAAVDSLDALTADLGVPEHLQQENPERWPSDFDANTYFTVLDHLALPEGQVLDYLYHYEWGIGAPFLYVRPADTLAYTEFPAEWGDNPPNYRDSILIEDTPEGYLQFIALTVMGDQFYLFWHANYNDTRIVCDPEALESILTPLNDFDQMLPEDVQQAARELDVTPTVEIGEEAVKVEVTIFTKWGGFLRLTYTISRDEPHTILEAESTPLVEYNCGVMF